MLMSQTHYVSVSILYCNWLLQQVERTSHVEVRDIKRQILDTSSGSDDMQPTITHIWRIQTENSTQTLKLFIQTVTRLKFVMVYEHVNSNVTRCSCAHCRSRRCLPLAPLAHSEERNNLLALWALHQMLPHSSHVKSDVCFYLIRRTRRPFYTKTAAKTPQLAVSIATTSIELFHYCLLTIGDMVFPRHVRY